MCTCPPHRFRDPTLSVGELVMQALKFSYEGILINRCQQSPFTAVVSVPADTHHIFMGHFRYLLDRGFCVVSTEYRLLPQ